MNLAAELNSTTVLTPTERERKKTPQQRAEDVIYTLNHTFTCLTLTDLVLVPVIRAITGWRIGHSHDEPPSAPISDAEKLERAHKEGAGRGMLTKLISGESKGASQSSLDKVCCAEGGAGHNHNHDHHEKLPFWKRAGHWAVGEAIGDVGAAFVTIPMQRLLPGMMDGIRRMVEPVVGGFFRRGAEHAAHKWADKHGLTYDNQDVIDRAHKLYEYEMHHLPQMAVWTVSSIGLHWAVMRKLEPAITVGEFARMKAVGAGITAATVFGARAAAPDKAHKWDETAGRYVVMPLTKTVGKVFGVKERDVDDYHARQTEQENGTAAKTWTSRVKAEPVSQAADITRQH